MGAFEENIKKYGKTKVYKKVLEKIKSILKDNDTLGILEHADETSKKLISKGLMPIFTGLEDRKDYFDNVKKISKGKTLES